MAGRPKMMAKKITDLQAKAEEVFSLISEYIPKQYEMHEEPLEKTDLLCQCWNCALFAAEDAMRYMYNLAIVLCAKADIPEPESSAATLAKIARVTEQRESAQAVSG